MVSLAESSATPADAAAIHTQRFATALEVSSWNGESLRAAESLAHLQTRSDRRTAAWVVDAAARLPFVPLRCSGGPTAVDRPIMEWWG